MHRAKARRGSEERVDDDDERQNWIDGWGRDIEDRVVLQVYS